MNTLERAIYAIGIVCAIVGGVATAFVRPKGAIVTIAALSDTNLCAFAAIVVISVVLSALTTYAVVRVGRNQPPLILLVIKLFVLALPAFSLGTIVAMTLGFFGVCEILQPPLLGAFTAAAYLAGGLAGMAAMNSISEYKRILSRALPPPPLPPTNATETQTPHNSE